MITSLFIGGIILMYLGAFYFLYIAEKGRRFIKRMDMEWEDVKIERELREI